MFCSTSGRDGDIAAGDTISSGSGIALVVDSEVTGYLMMGALSPGLKRHSVTLFEGGRISGQDSILELMSELKTSISEAAAFEGEMRHLAVYAWYGWAGMLYGMELLNDGRG